MEFDFAFSFTPSDSYLTTFKRLSLEFHSFTDSHINVS